MDYNNVEGICDHTHMCVCLSLYISNKGLEVDNTNSAALICMHTL